MSHREHKVSLWSYAPLMIFVMLLMVAGSKRDQTISVEAASKSSSKELENMLTPGVSDSDLDKADVYYAPRMETSPVIERVPATPEQRQKVQETTKLVEVAVSTPESIRAFATSYKGSRMDSEYLDLLYKTCGQDPEKVKLLVAIAVAETSLGRATKKQSNFWNWFKGGSRAYDPDRATMAQDMCGNFMNKYNGLVHNGVINHRMAVVYTGNDSPDNWKSIVQWALNKMK